MPIIKLEHSSNIKETIHTKEFFSSCHQIVVKAINTDIKRCQSRVECFDQFYVGQGSSQEAFIYLEIKILEGRTPTQLSELGKELSQLLKTYFAKSLTELQLQLAVRVIEFSSSHYFRVENTT